MKKSIFYLSIVFFMWTVSALYAENVSEKTSNVPTELQKSPSKPADQQIPFENWIQTEYQKRGIFGSYTGGIVTTKTPTPSQPVSTPAPAKSLGSIASIASVTSPILVKDTDSTPPVIGNLSINSKTTLPGDSIPALPLITASVTDVDSSLGDWSIAILDSQNNPVFTKSNSFSVVQTGTVSGNVTTALSEGTYTIRIVAKDAVGNTTTKNITSLVVKSGLRISNALNGPNPFNPNNQSTNIQYDLSTAADISITIYSISGEKLWWQNLPAGSIGATAGFNSVSWDGKNFGQPVPNGPCIAYIVATSGGSKSVAKIKILVLK